MLRRRTALQARPQTVDLAIMFAINRWTSHPNAPAKVQRGDEPDRYLLSTAN
jgi:hypothetical protein